MELPAVCLQSHVAPPTWILVRDAFGAHTGRVPLQFLSSLSVLLVRVLPSLLSKSCNISIGPESFRPSANDLDLWRSDLTGNNPTLESNSRNAGALGSLCCCIGSITRSGSVLHYFRQGDLT
jgi:hypothetical protein